MKATIKLLVSVCVTLFFNRLDAQVYLNAESGNPADDAANCWQFNGIGYSNTVVINGNYSGRTEELTAGYSAPKGVVSPWIRFGIGASISFQHRQITNSFATGAWRRCYVVSQLAADTGTNTVDTLYTYNYTTSGTQVENVNISLPGSYNTQIRKIYFSFAGVGGNERCVIDEISFNGGYNYWANPSNNCNPQSPPTDTDGDGVGDDEDAFPADQYKAYRFVMPENSDGTLLFEDLWPSKGDYDFNDLVANYRLNVILNAQANIVEISFRIVLRAWGASNKNGFALQFDGLNPNKIIRVTGMKNYSGSPFTLAANGTEANMTSANVVFVSDVSQALLASGGGGSGANTTAGTPFVSYDTTTITIVFMENGTAAAGGAVDFTIFEGNTLNPYMIVNQVRSHEVHMPHMPPTSKMNMSLFGTSNDDSNPATGRYYKTRENLPWILAVDDASIPYLKEKVDFTSGYLKFIQWVTSDGASYYDWYANETGYRDNTKLYGQ